MSRVLGSKMVLLPLFTSNNHWSLGVVEHARCAAESIRLYDPLPTDESTRAAQKLTCAFVKHYLPKTPPYSRLAVPYLSNRQKNTDDYGIFVFAFSLFKAVNDGLPHQLHGGLWRRILTACLGGAVTDWESLIP
ncbi:hypothetical protein LZ32DRAFT_487450, partial [Colletotrichum eremochloae]